MEPGSPGRRERALPLDHGALPSVFNVYNFHLNFIKDRQVTCNCDHLIGNNFANAYIHFHQIMRTKTLSKWDEITFLSQSPQITSLDILAENRQNKNQVEIV